jgi:hypothetical protein
MKLNSSSIFSRLLLQKLNYFVPVRRILLYLFRIPIYFAPTLEILAVR